MQNSVSVSAHAYERLKERLGLSKNAAARIAQKAYDGGLKHGDLNGRLEKYVSGIAMSHMVKGQQVRLYGNFVYLFIERPEDTLLVTVYLLPKNLLSSSLSKQKKLKG